MKKYSTYYKELERLQKENKLTKGMKAIAYIYHRFNCSVNIFPICDCSPRVKMATMKNEDPEAMTICEVRHILSSGKEITVESNGMRSYTVIGEKMITRNFIHEKDLSS